MVEKFHGMLVVSDGDLNKPKGNYVLEMDSAGNCVLRHYDMEMNEDEEKTVVDLLAGVKPDGTVTEANITGAIKRQLGIHSMLISESVIERIRTIVQA